MSMDLLDLGNGMMMNNTVAADYVFGGGGVGVGQPLDDDARSKLLQQRQPVDSFSKSPGGRGMAQASSIGGFFPFTNAQWKELERQAMVFKYMMHSIPVPYDLLFPFISPPSTDPSGLVVRRDTNLPKFLKNGDPEPGRCRRTDGKKWRCANAVAIDQKYCEKHVHRSRSRSRKHVEAPTASDLNKINKKPCLAQAQNQSSICPQVSVCKSVSVPRNDACLNLGVFTNGAFQLPTGRKSSVADVSVQCRLRDGDLSDEQGQQLMQFPQHHQLSLDSYTQQPKHEDTQEIDLFLNPGLKKPTSVLLDAWTLNSGSNTSSAQHDLISLGLSMGQGSYDNEDVSRCETKQDETHYWLTQSGGPLGEVLRLPLTLSPTTTNNASAPTCIGVLQEVVASLSDDDARHTNLASSTFSSQSESKSPWFNQDKLLKQGSN